MCCHLEVILSERPVYGRVAELLIPSTWLVFSRKGGNKWYSGDAPCTLAHPSIIAVYSSRQNKVSFRFYRELQTHTRTHTNTNTPAHTQTHAPSEMPRAPHPHKIHRFQEKCHFVISPKDLKFSLQTCFPCCQDLLIKLSISIPTHHRVSGYMLSDSSVYRCKRSVLKSAAHCMTSNRSDDN